jgi:hemerythrin-like domain-containing protein
MAKHDDALRPSIVPIVAPAPASATPPRRALLGAGAALGLTVVGGAAAHAASQTKPAGGKKEGKADGKEEDVGPGEDLMREHGVLRRVLLVYGEASRRLDASGDVDPAVIQKGAQLIRRFIEGYHERQEEEMVFPRFERAHKLVELVRVLRVQHQAGRKVTERVQALATPAGIKDPAQRRQLRDELRAFIRMYEPHASREDTVLFPALHDLLSPSEYDALGEDFERREHKVFGEDGFEHAVSEVDALERTLGIEDLAQFTPKA